MEVLFSRNEYIYRKNVYDKNVLITREYRTCDCGCEKNHFLYNYNRPFPTITVRTFSYSPLQVMWPCVIVMWPYVIVMWLSCDLVWLSCDCHVIVSYSPNPVTSIPIRILASLMTSILAIMEVGTTLLIHLTPTPASVTPWKWVSVNTPARERVPIPVWNQKSTAWNWNRAIIWLHSLLST